MLSNFFQVKFRQAMLNKIDGSSTVGQSWVGFTRLVFVTGLIVLAFTPSAVAAQPTAQTSSPGARVRPSIWATGGSVLVGTARGIRADEEPAWSGSYRLSLSAKHKPSDISMGTDLGYDQEYSYERDDGKTGDFSSWGFSLSKPLWPSRSDAANPNTMTNSWIDSFTVSVSGGLPVGDEARRRTFQGSLGAGFRMAKKMGPVNLSQGLSYARSFFEYDRRLNGVVNSPHAFRSRSGAELMLTPAFGLSLLYEFRQAISFAEVARASDMAAIELGYQVHDQLSVGLGVSSDRGSILSSDGQENTWRVFGANESTAYLDLVLAF